MSSIDPATHANAAPPLLRAIDEADPATVRDWLASGEAVLIDVREPDEHARERISGATCLPLSRFQPAQLGRFPGKMLVLHCRAGPRSTDACRMALLAGLKACSMRGGIEAWKEQGLPVILNVALPRMSVLRQVQVTVGSAVLAGSVLAWAVHPAWLVVPAFFGLGLVFAGMSGFCGMAVLVAKMPWNRVATTECIRTRNGGSNR